jgi:hypothetical protein
MRAKGSQATDMEGVSTSAQLAPFPAQRSLRSRKEEQDHVRFQPDLRPRSEPLRALIAHVGKSLKHQESALNLRQRQRRAEDLKRFELAIMVIVVNLAWVFHATPGKPLAVPRDRNLMQGHNRYRPACYGQGFLDALDLMAKPDVGLIENIQRGFKVGSRRQASLIRFTPAFVRLLDAIELDWDSFERLEPPELLILKSAKDAQSDADLIPYSDTDRICTMRNGMKRLNARLKAAAITLDMPAGAILYDNDGHPIDPTKRSLRRIFNNGSWLEGGRLYGGFWETMPRKQRFQYLRLDGEPVANVDFGQLFTRLAYHKAGCEPQGDDLYDILGDGSHRAGFKRLMNAMLFARAPLKGWPEGVKQEMPQGMSLKVACSAIQKRHAPLAHLFHTGLGFRLMFMESEALIPACLELCASGIPVLPLHDSVLVSSSKAETAKEVLQANMERATGLSRAAVSVEFCDI